MWSEPSPLGGMARLGIGTPSDGIHYPVGQPLLGDSLSLLLTSVANKELLRAPKALGGVHIYAQLRGHTATPRLDLPPPRVILAGSPPDLGKAWWEP